MCSKTIKKHESTSIQFNVSVNKTRFLVHHESWKCKGVFNESFCNSKQKWNHDEYWCDFKELNDLQFS